MIDRRTVLASAAVALLTAGARAQDQFPGRPIKIIVPTPAGSPVDVVARLVAQLLAGWTGLLGKAALPTPIIAQLNTAINAGLKTPEMRAALARLHADMLGGTPQDFAKLIADDTARWGPVVKSLNLVAN